MEARKKWLKNFGSLFIHSSVAWHLGYLQIWAITNESAMDIHTEVIVRTWVISHGYLGEELPGGMVRACLTL